MPAHDQIVASALEAVQNADRQAIVSAFVGSLSTRNLPARSAFGSLMVLQKLESHKFHGSEEFDEDDCAYCGLPKKTDYAETKDRIDKYPFQVQHTDIQYSAYDLKIFSKRKVDPPTQESKDCLQKILAAIRALPATAKLTELNNCLAPVIKSNKHERMILLETFGYAGILCPKSKHHYGTKFVTYDEANSDQPKESSKREWEYPVRFWTGNDGLNEKVVKSLFGAFL